MNRLYFGDCLTVMQDMPKWSVDLIYLDPPFNSQRQYNSIYKDATGRPLPDQVIAFNDMWVLDDRTEGSDPAHAGADAPERGRRFGQPVLAVVDERTPRH